MTARTLARRAVTCRLPRAGLDGGALSVRAWLLLAAGTAGGLVFTGVDLAEGATRAGYWTAAQPISALSLGLGGWVKQLNVIVFGVLVCLSAAGWRAALAPGRGALTFPELRVIAGVGLVMDGLFAQDPSGGDPPGARAGVPTVHGQAAGHGSLAGLWERAAGAATSVLTAAVLARLAVTSRSAARGCRLGPAAGEVA
jgi:Protein of unknown function (DUF998)